MAEQPPGQPAPTWVSVSLLITLGGGVALVVGDLLNEPAVVAVGLTAFLTGIMAMSTSVVVFARRTGIPLWSAGWKGIKTAGSLLWHLAP